jgi:hypothetical protein
MKPDFIDEPELEFGGLRRHVDIRQGLRQFGPLDATDGTPRRIRLGVVGTQQTLDGFLQWLDRCKRGIDAKASRQPNLFPAFPGFGDESPFRAEFEVDASLCRVLAARDLRALAQKSHYSALVGGVEMVTQEVRSVSEDGRPSVVVVALPPELVGLDEDDDDDTDGKQGQEAEVSDDELSFGSNLDLRNMLKAEVMKFGQPIQIVLPSTYDPTAKTRSGGADGEGRIQDEATRAWNIHTALYYKANYRPWRITRNPSDLKTCYVGVSFYRSLDKANLVTSLAQVYDERGEGVIVRGKPVKLTKDDRVPHLASDDAFALIVHALKEYRREHKHAPARLVLHKSSSYNLAEIEGFNRAIDDQELDTADLLVVSQSSTRLFRSDRYPPLRGTMLSLDRRHHLLYTRGSVPYYATYPGLYVPRPLKIQIAQGDESPRRLAEEILALTKLNWNNTQFDGGMPITMRVARDVGKVLKYVGAEGAVQPRYSFYM